MFKRILVATDGTELSAHAVDTALKLALSVDAQVLMTTVVMPFSAVMMATFPFPSVETLAADDYRKSALDSAQKLLQPALNAAQSAGVSCTALMVEHDQPWRGLLDAADAQACDLICMASHGRSGLSALLLGGQTQKVLAHAKVPVLVVR